MNIQFEMQLTLGAPYAFVTIYLHIYILSSLVACCRRLRTCRSYPCYPPYYTLNYCYVLRCILEEWECHIVARKNFEGILYTRPSGVWPQCRAAQVYKMRGLISHVEAIIHCIRGGPYRESRSCLRRVWSDCWAACGRC